MGWCVWGYVWQSGVCHILPRRAAQTVLFVWCPPAFCAGSRRLPPKTARSQVSERRDIGEAGDGRGRDEGR